MRWKRKLGALAVIICVFSDAPSQVAHYYYYYYYKRPALAEVCALRVLLFILMPSDFFLS